MSASAEAPDAAREPRAGSELSQLRVTDVKTVKFRVRIDGLQDGKIIYKEAGLIWGSAGKMRILNVGDLFPGVPYLITRITPKSRLDEKGRRLDTSETGLRSIRTNEEVVLVSGRFTELRDQVADLRLGDGGEQYSVHVGDVVNIPKKSGATYQVKEINPDYVILRRLAPVAEFRIMRSDEKPLAVGK